jgi:hypothetical protein
MGIIDLFLDLSLFAVLDRICSSLSGTALTLVSRLLTRCLCFWRRRCGLPWLLADGDQGITEAIQFSLVLGLGRLDHEGVGDGPGHGRGVEAVPAHSARSARRWVGPPLHSWAGCLPVAFAFGEEGIIDLFLDLSLFAVLDRPASAEQVLVTKGIIDTCSPLLCVYIQHFLFLMTVGKDYLQTTSLWGLDWFNILWILCILNWNRMECLEHFWFFEYYSCDPWTLDDLLRLSELLYHT